MKTKLKGFTLVELVITIAIVIILSVVSVPIYRGYVDKAKWSEAYALLGTITSAQKAYYSEYGNFLQAIWTCNDVVLGIDARGNKYFTYFNRGSVLLDPKIETIAKILIPEDFITDGYTNIGMQYNITRGSSIYKYNW